MRLCKYIGDCSILTDIVANPQIKATPPDRFDDPFEFSPRVAALTDKEMYDYFLLEKRRLGESYVAKWLLGTAARTLAEALEIVRDPATMMATAAIGMRQGITEHAKGTLRRASEEFGVICFTQNENDFLMWTFYGNYHKGAMIEFDSTSLERSFGKLLKVDYLPERVMIDPRMDLTDHSQYVIRTITRKAQSWQWQNEWRVLVLLKNCSAASANLWLAPVEPQAIKSVVFGAKCDPSLMPPVLKQIKSHKLTITTKKAHFHESDFGVVNNPLS